MLAVNLEWSRNLIFLYLWPSSRSNFLMLCCVENKLHLDEELNNVCKVLQAAFPF